MSNENLEIKYFQIGLEPEIFPAHDIDSVKEYLVKHDWPKEYIQDIDDGNYKLVSPDFEFKDDDGDKHKLSEWFLRDRIGQLIPGQVLELE